MFGNPFTAVLNASLLSILLIHFRHFRLCFKVLHNFHQLYYQVLLYVLYCFYVYSIILLPLLSNHITYFVIFLHYTTNTAHTYISIALFCHAILSDLQYVLLIYIATLSFDTISPQTYIIHSLSSLNLFLTSPYIR